MLQLTASVVQKLRIPILPLVLFSVHEIFHHHPVITHGGLKRIEVCFVKLDFNQLTRVYKLCL